MTTDIWFSLAERFIEAGQLPFPINDTVTEILRTIITEEQARFLLLLKKPSYNFDEIRPLTDLDDAALAASTLR